MNKERRKQIEAIDAKLAEVIDDLQVVIDAEQEAFDNMPESLQCADRGQEMEANIDALQTALDEVDSARSGLEGSL